MSETISKELTLTLKTKLDEKTGAENLRKKLKSYNLGREFNYAVAVLNLSTFGKTSITDKNTLIISLIPKVQYIVPFVNKELAEKYKEELSTLDKFFVFLPIGEDGRVIVDEKKIDNEFKEIDNLSINNTLTVIAIDLDSISEENKYSIKFVDEQSQLHELCFSYDIWQKIYLGLKEKFPSIDDIM